MNQIEPTKNAQINDALLSFNMVIMERRGIAHSWITNSNILVY